MLGLGAAAVAGGGIAAWLPRIIRHENGLQAGVFIGKAENYQANLAAVIQGGLAELGWDRDRVRGKRVLLKLLQGARWDAVLEVRLRCVEGHFKLADFFRGKPASARSKKTDKNVRLASTEVEYAAIGDELDLNGRILLIEIANASR